MPNDNKDSLEETRYPDSRRNAADIEDLIVSAATPVDEADISRIQGQIDRIEAEEDLWWVDNPELLGDPDLTDLTPAQYENLMIRAIGRMGLNVNVTDTEHIKQELMRIRDEMQQRLDEERTSKEMSAQAKAELEELEEAEANARKAQSSAKEKATMRRRRDKDAEEEAKSTEEYKIKERKRNPKKNESTLISLAQLMEEAGIEPENNKPARHNGPRSRTPAAPHKEMDAPFLQGPGNR